MKNKKIVLVTGGTGLLGKGLAESILSECKLISVHLRDYSVPNSNGVEHIVLDVLEKKSVEALFEKYEFDCVVHAAGIASVDYVEAHYEESRRSNIEGTQNIASACRKTGCHMIYVSTNAVFDGNGAPYAETSKPNPINKYGKIKLECEKKVSESFDHFTIFRPILMYGWHYPLSRSNPATWIIEKLSKGQKINIVTDVYENPLYNVQCGEILWQIIQKKPQGIIHAAGGEIVSRYEFAVKLAEIFGFSSSLIHPVDSSFFPSIAPRPKNTSFETKRIHEELSIVPMTVKEGLERMKIQASIQ